MNVLTAHQLWDWAVINASLRLLLTLLVTYKIVRYGHMLIPAERVGLGFIGGGGLLSIPVILGNASDTASPFDGWAATLMTLGMLVYFSGRLSRHVRHDRANKMAKDQAEEYLRKRGILRHP